MSGVNRVFLIGNLGKPPEIRYSQQGTAVTKFSIATSEKWTDRNTGQVQEKTEWHNIILFGKAAETCEKYLSKGSKVYIEGKIQTSTYEKDGQTRYFTEIVAQNFQFLDSREAGTQQGQNQHQNQQQQGYNTGTQQQNNYQQNQAQNQGGYQQGGSNPPPVPDDDIHF